MGSSLAQSLKEHNDFPLFEGFRWRPLSTSVFTFQRSTAGPLTSQRTKQHYIFSPFSVFGGARRVPMFSTLQRGTVGPRPSQPLR
jgi:hypothetical protein